MQSLLPCQPLYHMQINDCILEGLPDDFDQQFSPFVHDTHMSVTKVDKEEYESCHQEEHVSGPMTSSYSPGKVEDFEQPFVEILFDISNIQQIYTKCNTLII